MSWIITASIKKLDYLNPDPDQIIIEDIATGLSNMPRFAGQIAHFYSVAEHCIMAERQYVQQNEFPDKETCKAILMHDATEAFMCDIPTPLKNLLPDYKVLEKALDAVIKTKFNISSDKSVQELVQYYDLLLLKNEAVFERGRLNWLNAPKYKTVPVLDNFVILHMSPELAYGLFLKRWKELQ